MNAHSWNHGDRQRRASTDAEQNSNIAVGQCTPNL
jgi:hypothetical protein